LVDRRFVPGLSVRVVRVRTDAGEDEQHQDKGEFFHEHLIMETTLGLAVFSYSAPVTMDSRLCHASVTNWPLPACKCGAV
jgi:hypothetical protein